MSISTKIVRLFLFAFTAIISLISSPALFAGDFELYTPFMRITVPPGESIDYSIDVINNTDQTRNADISISGLPSGWTYT